MLLSDRHGQTGNLTEHRPVVAVIQRGLGLTKLGHNKPCMPFQFAPSGRGEGECSRAAIRPHHVTLKNTQRNPDR
ncbi:hypothetical protein ACODT3_17500 [Streptomyces sp. 4.24]|uniref:hypothetical protein n=1 Tax=Streptomyces tritrimontium TaxID=3406573 RepID=UPI003BB6799E